MQKFIFTAEVAFTPVASRISRNLREGNVETVVKVLRRVEQFGERIKAMAAYNVKLITSEGEKVITVPNDVYILDHAEEEGVDLLYSCRASSCLSCVGKVVSGTVDQSDSSFLDDEQMADGWLLTCVAYPTFDVA
ncbi:hypothetical protein K2173_005711 [Erythroxylum novogranatense]|uniref:Ferredoxin n=1 Tax=Erythroxylum novogranatense TaxID=1862640 RepID=A0AAV8SR83_9ROSI|nr:hypothetical protein K2173_005711 [Erythroxylum novogranatense]